MISSIVGAGIGLAGSLIGGISASQRAKEADKLLKQERATLDHWYAKEMATDYLDTSNAKSTLSFLEKNNKKSEQKLNNSNIKSGASAEQKVATASALNQNYANAMSNMSANDTAKKTNVNNMYMNRKSGLDQREYSSQVQKATTAGAITDLAVGLGNSMLKLDGAGVFDKKKK